MICKRFLPLFLALFLIIPTHAQNQSDSTYKNTIKLNSAAVMLNNISLLYERDLKKNWSVLLGAGYRWGGDIPKAFGLGSVVVTSSSKGLRGYSITPEVRYYFNFCDVADPEPVFMRASTEGIPACTEICFLMSGTDLITWMWEQPEG